MTTLLIRTSQGWMESFIKRLKKLTLLEIFWQSVFYSIFFCHVGDFVMSKNVYFGNILSDVLKIYLLYKRQSNKNWTPPEIFIMKTPRSLELLLSCSRDISIVKVCSLSVEIGSKLGRWLMVLGHEVYRRMSADYGKRWMFLTSVHEYQWRYHEGRTSQQNNPQSGQTHWEI